MLCANSNWPIVNGYEWSKKKYGEEKKNLHEIKFVFNDRFDLMYSYLMSQNYIRVVCFFFLSS